MSAGASSGGAGAGAVVRQGHLRKLKTMKKKYFVLRAETADSSAKLEYYESEKKFRAGASPRRVLPLKSCYNITRRLDLKQKHVIALFTREEQFCIVAENEKDLHEWLSAILKQHGCDDASEELLHPIQHVWQVNVQKKGLGASKNIQGLYNLCLTDKTLTLVKIKSHNNIISDLGIPERIEYSLKNIRRCGDSECFFYMEVGRQTSTGAGELWMHSDDSNIAQSMHSTIYLAMKNCAKMSENERDHIILPKSSSLDGPNHLPPRRQTYSDGRGRAGLSNEKGLCVGSCIRQCVCPSATYSIDDSTAAIAPLTPKNAENQPPNNSLISDKPETNTRVIKHHRTVSLPTGCPLFQEPLKIVHERTRSAPLTGDEVDRVIIEKSATHSSCKAVNGTDAFPLKKAQWSRRASTGTRLSKLSPAHTKNAGTLRNRCDSMPSRACTSFEVERPPQRHNEHMEGLESHDEPDALAEWYRTPRIPEEPDCCDSTKDYTGSVGRNSTLGTLGALTGPAHSRTSSLGIEEEARVAGYLPMAPKHDASGLVSASSGSVCSGTPSTDPRFSEYQLEPATSHILEGCARPPRAYSVGSRPSRPPDPPRHRAYSVGAHARPRPSHHAPRASAEDLMELDFSANAQAHRAQSDLAAKVVVARTPPTSAALAAAGFGERSRPSVNEYVDMSPHSAGYVEMRPGASPPHAAPFPLPPLKAFAPPPTTASVPDGYVEMNYTRAPTKPIAITSRPQPSVSNAVSASVVSVGVSSEAESMCDLSVRARDKPQCGGEKSQPRTPLGSQTLFPLSLDSPASPPELDATDIFDDDTPEAPQHPLSTVREISEESGRRSPARGETDEEAVTASPQYVVLRARPIAQAPAPPPPANPTAHRALAIRTNAPDTVGTATLVVAGSGAPPARFVVHGGSSPPASPGPEPAPLNYAALDLEPRRAPTAPAHRTYTQIDFVRSEKLHAADGT